MITETLIQNHLFTYLRQKGHTHIIPNYTPADWWECDIFSITRSGCWQEFEIKLTKADFKRDAAKGDRQIQHDGTKFVSVLSRSKHKLLEQRDTCCPTQFNYVIPHNLIQLTEIPEWAGCIEFHESGNRIIFTQTKKGPKLSNNKVTEKSLLHIGTCMYYRYWTERHKVNQLKKKYEYYRRSLAG